MADSNTPSNYTVMTNAGVGLATQLLNGQNKITAFRAVASDANHYADDQESIAEMTAIDSIKQDGIIQDVSDEDTNQSVIQVDFQQDKDHLDADYSMATIGLFATDENNVEVLYAIECLQHPQYMAQTTTNDVNSQFMRVVVGNVANVTITVSPAGTVSNGRLKTELAKYTPTEDLLALLEKQGFATETELKGYLKELPANAALTDKANVFSEQQTLAGGAVDGAGNAIATTKDVSDGDATTLKSAKEYADTQVSGKADDSTVVHTADMRKSASDVAGIEEVNAKQDKIGYTPADDSKVWHSTVTELNSTDMNTVITAGFYLSRSGTNGIPSGDNHTIYQVIPFYSSNGVQLAYGTNGVILGMRSWNNYNHFTDWVQFADDSKVAHLSGANNFDTVPTVNNNPLLLASSLPSDLARTGQDTNFTGKLQKSGIDVATTTDVTTAISTATANMVDSTKATNFTAGLKSGGVDVATAADLKSIEASAWRQLDQSNAPSSVNFRGQVLYKIDDTNKIIYFTTNGLVNQNTDAILINFEGIINNLLSVEGRTVTISKENGVYFHDMIVSSTYVKGSSIYDGNLISYGKYGQNYAYVTYDELV